MTSLTCEKKKNEEEEGDKEERIRGERAQACNEEERLKSAIIMKDRSSILSKGTSRVGGLGIGKK